MSSTTEDMERAVKSRDQGTITRAFHQAIYDRSANMDEALPAIRHFSNDPAPYVRFLAAQTLYIAGDRSGLPTLLAFVDSTDPVMDGPRDLRIEAALLLKKFREPEAAPKHLLSLYQRTKDSVVLNAIVRLLGEQTPRAIVADLIAQKGSNFGLFNLILTGDPEAKAAAKAAFIDPRVPEVYQPERKRIAAWGLARLTKDEASLNYLIGVAEAAIAGQPVTGKDPNEGRDALRFLASVQHPRVTEVLERALASPKPSIVECGVTNLLFNQPERSGKARQVVLHQLAGVPLVMESWERTFQIAVQLNDPEIRAAAEAFDSRSGDRSWHLWQKRRNWPIYNWLDEYVVAAPL